MPSDPYLMTGYDSKTLNIECSDTGNLMIEIDISGMGDWCAYKKVKLTANERFQHEFPEAFQAYWIRFRVDVDTQATAQLTYQ